jgi:hypothetical protein
MLLSIPITACCSVCPLLLEAKEIIFDKCFIRHAYEKDFVIKRCVTLNVNVNVISECCCNVQSVVTCSTCLYVMCFFFIIAFTSHNCGKRLYRIEKNHPNVIQYLNNLYLVSKHPIRSHLIFYISSHLISSHLISSHLISPHLIFSYLISSHLISSHLFTSYLLSSFRISSWPTQHIEHIPH